MNINIDLLKTVILPVVLCGGENWSVTFREEHSNGVFMGRGVAYTGVWWGILRERSHFGNPGADGRIIFRWLLMNWQCVCGLD